MIRRNFCYLMIVTCAAAYLTACETERAPCLEPREVYARLRFHRMAADTGTATVDTFFANMLFNPLDSPRAFTDTGIVSRNPFAFRLSPLADSCRYYFTPDSAQAHRRDTVTFFYRRQLQFLSNACGYTFYYNIDSVRATVRGIADTLHSIDSVVIGSREVNGDANREHFKFYIHR